MGKEMAIPVPPKITPIRVDLFLKENLEISRARIKELLAQGWVHVNGKKIKKGDLLSGGETITVAPKIFEPFELSPDESIPLRIIHEEPSFLIVDKPSGIPTHPLKSGEKGTLANALIARYPELGAIGDPREAGLVHRLDSATSGLLVVARTLEAYQDLREQFRTGKVTKQYLALVWGILEKKGKIETSFDSKNRKKVKIRAVIASPEGAKQSPKDRHVGLRPPRDDKRGRTQFKPLRWGKDQTLLEILITTGHRHQIRAHLAHLGHPIVGDELYGTNDGMTTLSLRATQIQFQHPENHNRVQFKSMPTENRWRDCFAPAVGRGSQ
ncbi:MAG: RluA family pseudouridine synthase [Deltaproteobacteria bacterium]|nr:RluA family pseudouridine synthase [Deltaproteobacteria bacterium]